MTTLYDDNAAARHQQHQPTDRDLTDYEALRRSLRPNVPQPVLLTAERKARRDGWAVSVLSPDGVRWRYKPHQVDDLHRPDHLATVYRDGTVEYVVRDAQGRFDYLDTEN